MPRYPKGGRAAGAAVALGWLIALASAGSAASPVVREDAGRVTLHAEKVPLATLLEELGRASGATIRGPAPSREVSIDLDEVPLEDALANLLGRDNFALTYGADGRLRAIELLGAASEKPAWPPPGLSVELPGVAPERQQEVMSRTVDVTGRLAAALGTTRPTAGQLIHAALRQKSGKARIEAQRRVLAAFDADPELEDVFSRTLRAIDDPTLAKMLRSWGVDRSEEFMAKLAAQARSPELRAKASAVLEQLRAPAGADAAAGQGPG